MAELPPYFDTILLMRIAFVLILLTILGCPTGYRREGFRGGHSDYRAGSDRIYVSYSGNAFTSAGTIIRYWHLRAAEICGGDDKYEVLARSDRASNQTVGTAKTRFEGNATTYGNRTAYSGTATHDEPVTIIKHTAEGYIRCVGGGVHDPNRRIWNQKGQAVEPERSGSGELLPPEKENFDVASPAHSIGNGEVRMAAGEAPIGAVGYEFGLTRDAVDNVCRSAGKEIAAPAPNITRCSGTSPEYGSDAVVLLRFCQDLLCQIDVSFLPYGNTFVSWITRFDELSRALQDRYGRPSSNLRRVTSECARTHPSCFESGASQFSLTWRWTEGTALKLASGRTDTFVHVNYFSAQALLETSTAAPGSRGDAAPSKPHYLGL